MKKNTVSNVNSSGYIASETTSERKESHQRAICLRLKRVEGQIRGVLRMIENDEPCNDIAQQLAAARNALDRAFFEMMACSIESEIIESTESDASKHARVSEILKVLSKYA